MPGANVHVGTAKKGAWPRGATPAGQRGRRRPSAHATPEGHEQADQGSVRTGVTNDGSDANRPERPLTPQTLGAKGHARVVPYDANVRRHGFRPGGLKPGGGHARVGHGDVPRAAEMATVPGRREHPLSGQRNSCRRPRPRRRPNAGQTTSSTEIGAKRLFLAGAGGMPDDDETEWRRGPTWARN